MRFKKSSGQILILVLLVVVVALAAGLSVASRNITNLRTSTQTEQSQRAFTAAEGGVEDVLQRLTSIANTEAVKTPSGYSEIFPVGDLQTTVNVKSQTDYSRTIELGDVGQINLDGLVSGNVVKIEWSPRSDSAETANSASIEAIVVYESGGSYSQGRFAFGGGSGLSSGNESGAWSSPNCSSSDYNKCATVTLASGAQMLRIKPFWNKATVEVTCFGCTLPVQFYEISSVATTDLGVTRKVQVLRSALAELPAFFDYALYSEGDIIK